MSSQLQSFMHGGVANINRKKEIWQVITKHKASVERMRRFPRTHNVEDDIRSGLAFTKLINAEFISDKLIDYLFVHELSNGMYGLGVHGTMYVPAIKSLGSPEQVKKWLGDESKLEIIGSFVQTELGHGSSVRDIETTVTYDDRTGDLVVNTPSVRAVKWWPGMLGHLANCIILQAQLYIHGECLGVHSFLVQIRDFQTHDPLRGIEVGPLPIRMTGNFGNSGFLRFHNVRIPRENLLEKVAKIDESGRYHRMGHDRKSYVPMMIARIVIAMQAVECLKKALFISIRYNLIRRQGAYGAEEVLILDHQTQQLRLLPPLALSYAMSATSFRVLKTYSQIEDPAEVHLLTCCIKAHCAELATRACEAARRAVGGNGFLEASQLGPMATMSLVTNTVEGDNVLLYIQIGRLLLSTASGQRRFQAATFVHMDIASASPLSPPTPEKLLLLPQLLCKRLLQRTARSVSQEVADGASISSVVQGRTQELVEIGEVFCDFLLLHSFMKEKSDGNYKDALLDHIHLASSLHLVHMRMGLYLQNGVLTTQESCLIKDAMMSSLRLLRDNVETILDGLYLPEDIFGSLLVSDSEGELYSKLFEEGQKTMRSTFKVNPRLIPAKL